MGHGNGIFVSYENQYRYYRGLKLEKDNVILMHISVTSYLFLKVDYVIINREFTQCPIDHRDVKYV